jgi:hypothetical protein
VKRRQDLVTDVSAGEHSRLPGPALCSTIGFSCVAPDVYRGSHSKFGKMMNVSESVFREHGYLATEEPHAC